MDHADFGCGCGCFLMLFPGDVKKLQVVHGKKTRNLRSWHLEKQTWGGSEGQIRESLSLGNQKHKKIDGLL